MSGPNFLQTLNFLKPYQAIKLSGKTRRLTDPPRQSFINKTEEQAIGIEIFRLLEKNIIVESTHEEGEFLSAIFTRPKCSGGYRRILNLSKLNEFVEYHHFKMDTLEVAMKLIDPHCFMASIDLKDAYCSVPIHDDHQKYLIILMKRGAFQIHSSAKWVV